MNDMTLIFGDRYRYPTIRLSSSIDIYKQSNYSVYYLVDYIIKLIRLLLTIACQTAIQRTSLKEQNYGHITT